MSEQQAPSRAADIIREVTQNVLEGRLALAIATRFREAISTGRLPSDRWLYRGIGISCWQDALLSLSRLLDRSSDGITLARLLNYSEQNPCEYPLATPDEVRRVVARQRAVLAPNPLWETIRHLRDTTLAHTDLRHITDPLAVQISPIETAAVEQAFTQLLGVINSLRRLRDGSIVAMDHVDHLVRLDFEYLVSLFEKARADHEAKREAVLRLGDDASGSANLDLKELS